MKVRLFTPLSSLPLCLWLAAILFAPLLSTAAAQVDHQYSAEQIQSGYRLYASQCQLCHGANGDGVGGTNLGRQQFRFVTTDADIRKMVANGSTGGGMPSFAFKDEEVDGLIAFIRSGMDRSGVSFRLGDAVRGKAVYDRSGCAGCPSYCRPGRAGRRPTLPISASSAARDRSSPR